MPCRRVVTALVLLLFVFTAANADEPRREPIIPKDRVFRLFNGQNLDGLYTWLRDAKHDDPRKVFTVHDGLLHISGDGWGGVTTKDEYRDYHLVAEFKWGERTWAERKERARDSGVLIHCTGPDGNYNNTWMNSIEAQIIEGGVGDILVVRGTNPEGPKTATLTAEVTKDRDGENVWKTGGERMIFERGRINWYGRDPDWKDVLGFRGQEDVDSPHGRWTRMDVICDGGRVTIFVNGVIVNEGFDAVPSAGKLLFQTEGAEIFVRRWELWPLGKAPAFNREQFRFTD